MGVIAQVADTVAVMYLGRIAEMGTTDDVVFEPKHPYSVGLIDAIPKLDNLDEKLKPVPGDIPSPLSRPTGCPFHTRCSQKIAQTCEARQPGYTGLSLTHMVSCHLFPEGAER